VLLTGLREDVARFAGLDNVARGDTLLRILRERGFEPAVQLFANTAQQREPRAQGRNLVVTVGSGPRDIVIGAHYDAVRLADGRVTGGAVDNGAGAVIMTRVAETLRGQALRHRVRVVLFDLEEVGLLGSQAYIAAEGAERVAAMVNVDIAAHGDAIVYGPASHTGNTQVYREFRQVCAVHGPCIEFPAFPRSDDRSFQAAGVPNISIGIAPAVDAHQLWLLLNAGPNAGLREGLMPALMGIIHTPADTLAHVDPAAMQRLHDAVVALVLRLDAAL
jgi:Zn-dependent M28 family amino/carboxypeptidase